MRVGDEDGKWKVVNVKITTLECQDPSAGFVIILIKTRVALKLKCRITSPIFDEILLKLQWSA